MQTNNDFYFNIFFLFIRFHYAKNFNADREVLYGLHESIETIIPYKRTRFELDQQLDKFKKAQGLFGRSMALNTRDKKKPGKIFS